MSWNRDYRPRAIADLHLHSVREYFSTLMASTKFPQVFLFAGPKGTGKTSTARIIGAVLNDPSNAAVVEARIYKKSTSNKALKEPNKSLPELDVIFTGHSYLVQEIDAASNRGIDDIRALKEQVQLPPVQGLVSVYILDEVHMLTSEAFNALLKLLEEPPPHVIFILATTELQKVPATIVSRCQVVQFSLASESELVESLKNVAKSEKLSFPDDLFNFIAQQANGSFRDAIKLLEHASIVNATSVEELKVKIGSDYSTLIPQLVQAVISKDTKNTVEVFQDLRQRGAHEVSFHKDLVAYLHEQLLFATKVKEGETTIPFEASRFLLQELSASELSQTSPLPFLRLELKLLEVIERALKKTKTSEHNPPAALKVTSTKTPKMVEPQLTDAPKNLATLHKQDTVPQASKTNFKALESLSGDGESLYQNWHAFVTQVAQTNFSLATLLKSAHPISGEIGKITLSVYYKFHQEQLQQAKFSQQLNSLISLSYGGPVQIDCILSDQPSEAELKEPDSMALKKLATDALM